MGAVAAAKQEAKMSLVKGDGQQALFEDDDIMKMADKRRTLREKKKEINEELQTINDQIKNRMAERELTTGIVKYKDGEKELLTVKTSLTSKKVVDKDE